MDSTNPADADDRPTANPAPTPVGEPPRYFGVFINETIIGSWRERSVIEQWVHGTEAQAQAAAESTAWGYVPARPTSPQRRRVYRTGPRSWTVIVDGRTSTWRFDVSYGELVGERQENG